MKKTLTFIFALLAMCSTLETVAQTIVKDKDDGTPVAYASVFDAEGELIGMTSVDGELPDISNTTSISISHVAYEPLVLQTSQVGAELLLSPADFMLGDIVIKPKEIYCIRLTGYLRSVTIPVEKKNRDKKFLGYEDGKGECYLFVKGKSAEWYDVVNRDLLTGEMKSGGRSSTAPIKSTTPFIDNLVKKGDAELRQANGYKQVVGKAKGFKQWKGNKGAVIGSVKPDTKSGIITTSYDAIYPDSIFHYNSLLAKLKIFEAKESEVYRKPSDSDDLLIENLLVRSHTAHMWMKIMGRELEARRMKDFYVSDVDYLSKEEYKAAMKEMKALRKQKPAMTSSQLSQYASSLKVKPLPASVRNILKQN